VLGRFIQAQLPDIVEPLGPTTKQPNRERTARAPERGGAKVRASS
jgi:hypothetical protein